MGRTQDNIDAAVDGFLKRLDELDVRLMYQEGGLYRYTKGAWDLMTNADQEGLNPILYAACSEVGCDFSTRIKPIWLTAYTRVMPPTPILLDDECIVACNNGALELSTRELLPYDPTHYTTRRLDVNYDPDADCPHWKAMLVRMLESPDRTEKQIKAMVKFLQQWTGINLVGPAAKRGRDLKQGLIIEGPSNSGKSTYGDVMIKLFGRERVVSPSIDDLSTQFGKSVLVNAQALISNDGISVKSKGDAKILKNIVTGELITVDRKFKEHVSFKFEGPVLFTTNTLPTIEDETDAIYNRFVLVKMDKVFTKADAKRDLNGMNGIDFLLKNDELPGIVNWALDGFESAYAAKSFAQPEEAKNAAVRFRTQNDPLYGFLVECTVPDERWSVPANVMTALYTEYALDNYQSKVSLKKASASLHRNVKDVVPGVRYETQLGSSHVSDYVGVKLNELGLAYWSKVKAKDLGTLSGTKTAHHKVV